MRYTIRHITRLAYETPISESVMEARMRPRSDANQRCLRFALSTVPASRVRMYEDDAGNLVHHFNIPGRHSRLTVTADTLVECVAPPPLPESMDRRAWETLDEHTASGEFWDALHPSPFARPTSRLGNLAREIAPMRDGDPLETLRRITGEVHRRFEYKPQSTRVDSPIDDALESRQGVCQDFAHIMIALVRRLGIPCRYVSGYLFHQTDGSTRSADGATHAWVEAWLPGLGWIGFDPTNNGPSNDRHVRVAVGRDYADVPPTRGVFKGTSAIRSELAVSVRVGPVEPGSIDDAPTFVPWASQEATASVHEVDGSRQQQ